MPVTGKRVLILSEGGTGDSLMLHRYLAELEHEDTVCVHVAAGTALHDLFAAQPHGESVLSASIPDYDLVAWTFDLFMRYQHSPYFPNWQNSY
ncbi:hypothetical protein DP62_5714 [Burkholderia pseudomallei]|uniref:hypothetical protein n=1 Tax=Burkholderia pseudomallei TaxID=28450 RepID=UPI00050E16D7|nr:hypothetical protein [Burkholderia pseudomallei]KGC96348.1 hypothetical protein DP62_5714 [Burkholderia pseudomallei]